MACSRVNVVFYLYPLRLHRVAQIPDALSPGRLFFFGISIAAFLPPPYIQNVYQFTYTEQNAPDTSEVHRSLQNCWSSVWDFLRVICLAFRIRGRPLPFGKYEGPCHTN